MDLLQLCILFSPLLRNLLFGELSCLTLQHRYPLVHGQCHLVTHWHEAFRQVLIILLQQIDGEKHVVDVVEHERMLVGVLLLLRQKRHGVFTPVTERIQVVRGVVAIVVAVSVALLVDQRTVSRDQMDSVAPTATSMSVMLDLKSESGSTSSTSAC